MSNAPKAHKIWVNGKLWRAFGDKQQALRSFRSLNIGDWTEPVADPTAGIALHIFIQLKDGSIIDKNA